MKKNLKKLGAWVLSYVLPWVWGATRKVWNDALASVNGLDTHEILPAAKLSFATQWMARQNPALDAELLKRVVQAAHNYVRLKEMLQTWLPKEK
jgi:hypothetical protein